MKLTTIHATYWRERQREPAWLLKVYTEPRRIPSLQPRHRTISIDAIVNANAGNARRPWDAVALCHVLRLARKRAGMPAVREVLERCAGPNHYVTDTKQRRRYARKWLQRLNRKGTS